MWIEVFRTGRHTDSAGRTESYNAEKLDLLAAKYNHRVSESESNLAPVVKGHPKDNDPAYGWVERLARRGTKLMAKLKELTPELIEEVRNGNFKKISIALYNDLMLRHIGFLGAVPPAVEGLKPVSFTDISEYLDFEHYSCITEEENNDEGMDSVVQDDLPGRNCNSDNDGYKKEIEHLQSLNAEFKAKIGFIEKEQRLKEFRKYVNSLIESSQGAVITPAQADKLIDILEMAHQSDTPNDNSEFRDNLSNVEKVKQFISSLRPVFDCREYAVREINGIDSFIGRKENTNTFRYADTDYSDKAVSPERLHLHNRAIEIKALTPGLSYEEAVCEALREDIS